MCHKSFLISVGFHMMSVSCKLASCKAITSKNIYSIFSNLSSLSPSHSRCVHGLCVPKGQSYSCQCSEGYQGQFCDRRQEPPACRGQRCGHGECRVSEGGEPVCHCQPGYTGPTCNTGNTEEM